ncbi:MAG: hypothetical protein R2825_02500 [Saprospiraceae bacterium]
MKGINILNFVYHTALPAQRCHWLIKSSKAEQYYDKKRQGSAAARDQERTGAERLVIIKYNRQASVRRLGHYSVPRKTLISSTMT